MEYTSIIKNICTLNGDISSQYIVYGNKRPINNFKILNNDNNYIVSEILLIVKDIVKFLKNLYLLNTNLDQ